MHQRLAALALLRPEEVEAAGLVERGGGLAGALPASVVASSSSKPRPRRPHRQQAPRR